MARGPGRAVPDGGVAVPSADGRARAAGPSAWARPITPLPLLPLLGTGTLTPGPKRPPKGSAERDGGTVGPAGTGSSSAGPIAIGACRAGCC